MRTISQVYTSVYRFLHPERPGGLSGVAYALLCAVLLAGFGAQQVGALPAAEGMIGGVFEGSPYTPPAPVFHLSDVRYVVHSYAAWDSGVLGATAVDDIDYLITPWGHDQARLPGGPWITYHYLGYGFIPGSGTYLAFSGPGGTRFAYFHLTYTRYHLTMHGGDVVGQTGWPTSVEYSGGGPADGSDAHLCVAVNAQAAYFLQHLPGKPKPAHPFKVRIWRQYRAEHHLRLIAYKGAKGHLYASAKLWMRHDPVKIGGIVWVHHCHAKVDYTEYRFQGAQLITWAHKGYKPRWYREPWRR